MAWRRAIRGHIAAVLICRPSSASGWEAEDRCDAELLQRPDEEGLLGSRKKGVHVGSFHPVGAAGLMPIAVLLNLMRPVRNINGPKAHFPSRLASVSSVGQPGVALSPLPTVQPSPLTAIAAERQRRARNAASFGTRSRAGGPTARYMGGVRGAFLPRGGGRIKTATGGPVLQRNLPPEFDCTGLEGPAFAWHSKNFKIPPQFFPLATAVSGKFHCARP
jgi:hypothetical protein